MEETFFFAAEMQEVVPLQAQKYDPVVASEVPVEKILESLHLVENDPVTEPSLAQVEDIDEVKV